MTDLQKFLVRVEKIAAYMQKEDPNNFYILSDGKTVGLDDFISWSELRREAEQLRGELKE